MSTPQSAALNSRTFTPPAPSDFWSALVGAMPIVIFYRALREVLKR
jgi:hypothetical protein